MILNTYNDGSYILKSSIQNIPVSLKFDYNDRVKQWFVTITSGDLVLLGSKALTPNSIIPIINLDLNLVSTIALFQISPTSVPMSLWGGYYYILLGD